MPVCRGMVVPARRWLWRVAGTVIWRSCYTIIQNFCKNNIFSPILAFFFVFSQL